MRHLHLFPLPIRRAYLVALIFLLVAGVLGAIVRVYWQPEYAQCLAVPGGFSKIFARTCTVLP